MSRRGRGKQTELGAALGKLARTLDAKSAGAFTSARVAAVWEGVVGPQIAAHTAEPFLRDYELVVAVDSPVWASELSAMSEELRKRLNAALGKESVRRVRFTVSPEVSRTRKRENAEDAVARHYEPDTTVSVALSAEELEAVRTSAASIADPALREAAIRATVKHLEWSKGISAAKRA